MGKTEVFLFVNGGGVREKIAAAAEETDEGGVHAFRFCADGAEFSFRFGGTAVIERSGGIAYRIELDPSRTTYTEIVTEYGFLSAGVKTLRSEISRKNGFYFKGEYELLFEGYAQRHELSLFAHIRERRQKQ